MQPSVVFRLFVLAEEAGAIGELCGLQNIKGLVLRVVGSAPPEHYYLRVGVVGSRVVGARPRNRAVHYRVDPL